MPSQIFVGQLASLEKIANFVVKAAREANFDSKGIYAIQLAVDEACSNIIEHAYAGQSDGIIRCTYEILENGLKITLQDWGKPFNPADVPKPNFNVQLDDLKPRGAGLYFMKEIMDEVVFEFDEKNGNLLTMIKWK